MPSSSAGGVRAGRNGGGGSSGGGGGGGAADGGGRKMGRKMDASHLLNFSLPARQEVQAPPRRSRRTGGGEGARWTLYNKESASCPPCLSAARGRPKLACCRPPGTWLLTPFPISLSEEFVNASFSFMLNPKGDYTAYFVDSDIFFNWPDILQILVPSAAAGTGDVHSPGLPSCPICLSVSRTGHACQEEPGKLAAGPGSGRADHAADHLLTVATCRSRSHRA